MQSPSKFNKALCLIVTGLMVIGCSKTTTDTSEMSAEQAREKLGVDQTVLSPAEKVLAEKTLSEDAKQAVITRLKALQEKTFGELLKKEYANETDKVNAIFEAGFQQNVQRRSTLQTFLSMKEESYGKWEDETYACA